MSIAYMDWEDKKAVKNSIIKYFPMCQTLNFFDKT